MVTTQRSHLIPYFNKIQVILRSLKPTVWTGLKLKTRLDKTFTIKKVKAAFHHMGSFKLGGPDGIRPIVMKHFGPRTIGCITKIYQAIYSTGYSLTVKEACKDIFDMSLIFMLLYSKCRYWWALWRTDNYLLLGLCNFLHLNACQWGSGPT